MSHNWTYDDDVISYYLCKYGFEYADNKLLFNVDVIGTKLGMGSNSLKARIGNFKYLEGRGGFSHVANLSKEVFGEFKNVPQIIHLKKVKKALGLKH